MASHNLDDIFIDVPLNQVSLEEAIYRSALWNSGVIETDADMSGKVGANDGRLFQSRYWKDLGIADDDADPATGNGPVYPDDSDNNVPLFTIAHGLYQQFKTGAVMAWGEKEIIRLFGFLDDPLGVVQGRAAAYWGKYYDQYAIAQMNGVLADNVANDAGDMVNDIGDADSAPDAVNSVNPTAIIDTMATAGDTMDDFSVMIAHSKVVAQLRKQNLIDTIPAADGRTIFNFYQNLRLLTSDQVPIDTSGTNPVATTIIAAPGAMGYGASSNGITPMELWRDPRTGLGSGETQLITRIQFTLHTYGFSWLDAAVTGSASVDAANIYPNMADQANAANWDRVATSRKQVRLAFLLSNV